MKIETNRYWYLKTRRESHGCIDIRERHNEHPDDGVNHVIVPYEAIPALVRELTDFYNKQTKGKRKNETNK